MADADPVRVEVSKQIGHHELERRLNENWRELVTDLSVLPGFQNVTLSDKQRKILCSHALTVEVSGAGTDPSTIALLISLTPLTKALVPLVQPFAKEASDVAHTIALDLWNILKQRLWEKQHIKVKEK